MRSTMPATVLVALSLGSVLAACEGNTPLASSVVVRTGGGGAEGADAAATLGGGPVNLAPQKAVAPDAGADAAPPTTVTAPAEIPSCASLASGGAPDGLQDFMWQHQVAAGESSRAWDFVSIKDGCTLGYQHEDTPRTVTMAAGDCADARSWVTNARFLEVLRTSAGCSTDDGKNATESFELTLEQDVLVARKTFLCPEPTIAAVRACLSPLVARLFPN
jgi:hypothetical protein